MLYIIEGIDKCGKSTFIHRNQDIIDCEGIEEFVKIAKHLKTGDKVAIHFSSNDKDPVGSIRICAAFSGICDIYMDRCWISDMTYGPVYRGEFRLEPRDEQYILGLLQETPHIIYYFDKQIAEPDTSDEFEKDQELVNLVKFRYDQIIVRYKDTLNIYKVEAMI